jgi:hypothetical protein
LTSSAEFRYIMRYFGKCGLFFSEVVQQRFFKFERRPGIVQFQLCSTSKVDREGRVLTATHFGK